MNLLPGIERLSVGTRRSIAEGLVILASALFLVLLGDKLTASPAYAAGIAVMAAAVVLMVIDFKLALFLFLAFLISYEEFDLSSQEAFLNIGAKNTVLAVTIMGVSLMDFLTLALLVPVLLREWRHAMLHGRIRWFRSDLLALGIALLWVYGAVQGLFHTLTVSTYTWDLRDLAHVLVLYFIFSRTFDTRRDILIAVLVMFAVFVLKNGVFLYRYMSGGGLLFAGGYYRILIGSDLPLTALMLTSAVAAVFTLTSAGGRVRMLLFAAIAYFTIMLLAGLGKLTYLQGLAGLGMIFFLFRREIRLRTILSVLVIGVLGALVFYYTVLSSASREILLYAVTSAFGWWEAIEVYADLSFGTRLLEIINTWATLQRENALLFGLGWGAPWYEIASHMPFDGGAFDPVEQMRGVHVQAHIDATKFILKLGIVGTLVLYGIIFRFWQHGVRMFRATTREEYRWLLLVLMLMILIIAPNYIYFIRLKFLLGFALAGIAVFRDDRDGDTEYAGGDPQSEAVR